MIRPTTSSSRSRTRGLIALVLGGAAACGPGSAEDTARSRGDVAFARDSLELARAEYLLATQRNEDASSLARVAHTFVRLGRVEEARDYYQAAVEDDPSLSDQATADFLRMAREAAGRGDDFQMASAMDAALTFTPGVSVTDLALPLARHHFENGEYGRALPFYLEGLAQKGDSAPDLVFEIGQAYEEIGDCERALVFFERFREMRRPWERGEVDWYIGSCAIKLAAELATEQMSGRGLEAPSEEEIRGLEAALELFDRTIAVGEPRGRLGDAWFQKGEVLARLGRCDEAEAAFEAVQQAEASPNTALARRAAERYDQIRFGRGLDRFRRTGGCG